MLADRMRTIRMEKELWLYEDGEEYENVTGGWLARINNYGNNAFANKESSYFDMYANQNGTSHSEAIIKTIDMIDITKFNKLYVEWNIIGISKPGTRTGAVVSISKAFNPEMSVSDTTPANTIDDYVLKQSKTLDISEFDISDWNGEYRITCHSLAVGNPSWVRANFHKIWLEK